MNALPPSICGSQKRAHCDEWSKPGRGRNKLQSSYCPSTSNATIAASTAGSSDTRASTSALLAASM